jgi:iron complex outermembrane recepter protein
MLKPGSRLGGAVFAVIGLFIADARLAFAQEQATEGIQEVVVTAQRREENLQTTPIAITALSAESLIKDGVTDFKGVAEQSTSINFTPYPSSSNTLILYMRGQGVADANQITQDGSVGLYEDGFYIARPQAETFDLADVERVEILRGPQGTLYGRNTTGGAVNIISQKPTGDFDVKFSLDGGQRDYVRALGTINLPYIIDDHLATKVTLLYSNLAGNVSNSGGEDYNRENQRGARVSLRWNGGSLFTADYFFEIGEIDSTPIYYQDPALAGVIPGYEPSTNGLASHTWEPIYLPISTAKFNSDGLTLNFKFNDAVNLRSLTYYRGLDSRFYQDYAGAFTNPAAAPVEGITNFTGDDIVQSNEFTQELQLVGSIGKQVDYVAGLYYYQESANHAEAGTIGIPEEFIPGIPIFTEDTDRYVTAYAKSKAAYAQFTWHVTEPLSLTLGGRYTKDNRNATRDYTEEGTEFNPPPPSGSGPPFQFPFFVQEVGANNSLSFSKFNPAGTINYAWTPDINTYFRGATGYKAGGSSEAGPIGSFGQTFQPENVTTYELGLKSYWFEHKVRANIAVFHSKFSDMQLQFDVDPTNLAIVESYNAGSATVNGAEFEFLFAPIPDLTIGLNDTILSTDISTVTALPGTVFDPSVNPGSPYTVCPAGSPASCHPSNVADLFRVPYAPNNIVNGNIDWTMFHVQGGGNLELYLNYRYQGRQYDTATTGVNVPNSAEYYSIAPYGLLDGRLTWNFDTHSSKTMRVSLWCKNCFNKDYEEHVIGQGAAPFVPVPNTSYPYVPPIIPVTGYTYQAQAWAPKFMFGAQFQYGF